jgi:methylated-DNA-[protein]-cysteine S-methyltransferase
MSIIEFEVEEFASPVGPITLVSCAEGVNALEFQFEGSQALVEKRLASHWGMQVCLHPRRQATDFRRRVESYFAGDLRAVEGIPVKTRGTGFQQTVWQALRTIPAGRTTTYGALAERIGRPKAVRAVGLANAMNPVAVIVPCHRVVGANGSLTGYAAGLPLKEWLLDHEGARLF